MRVLILVFSLILSFVVIAEEIPDTTNDHSLTVRMRPVDRDWTFFQSISCDRLHKIVFHSRNEELLLAKRKNQCVNQYKAFLPQPVNR